MPDIVSYLIHDGLFSQVLLQAIDTMILSMMTIPEVTMNWIRKIARYEEQDPYVPPISTAIFGPYIRFLHDLPDHNNMTQEEYTN